MAEQTVHVLISGRVQGVGYRAWVEMAASSLRLSGWVRNRRDGAVEAVFQGAPADVDEKLQRCRQGPPDARVTEVEIVGEGVGVYRIFQIKPTI